MAVELGPLSLELPEEHELFDESFLVLRMPLTQGILSTFLHQKARSLSAEEKSKFLAFASSVKKYYQASLKADVTFSEILDFERKNLTEAWAGISAEEESGMYEVASQLN